MQSKQVIAMGAHPLPAYDGSSHTTNAERGRHEIEYTSHAGERDRGGVERHVRTHVQQRGVDAPELSSAEGAGVADASPSRAGDASADKGDCGAHAAGVAPQITMSTSDSKNLTVVGPRSQLQWVSVIGSSPVDWYAISAEQADALPHVWQKGASAMGGLLGLAGGLINGFAQQGRSSFQLLGADIDAQGQHHVVAIEAGARFEDSREAFFTQNSDEGVREVDRATDAARSECWGGGHLRGLCGGLSFAGGLVSNRFQEVFISKLESPGAHYSGTNDFFGLFVSESQKPLAPVHLVGQGRQFAADTALDSIASRDSWHNGKLGHGVAAPAEFPGNGQRTGFGLSRDTNLHEPFATRNVDEVHLHRLLRSWFGFAGRLGHAGDDTGHAISGCLRERLGPEIDRLDSAVAHGLSGFFGSAAKQFDCCLLFHAAIVNVFTA